MKYVYSFLAFNWLIYLQAQVFTNEGFSQNLIALSSSLDGWGNGVSIFDFNQDGWDDLSIVNNNDTIQFYMNNHGVLERAPFEFYSPGENKHLLWVDYDNDNDYDILLTRKNGTVLLLQNEGNMQFIDVTLSAGLPSTPNKNYSASFADYDLDGDLDLFVVKYDLFGDSTTSHSRNNLYQNNGDGTFTDLTLNVGFRQYVATSYQGLWFDYNRDIFPDLFVINDRTCCINEFYKNNGDGTFTDVVAATGTQMVGQSPMSLSIGDHDNDGDYDFYISNTGTNSSKGVLFSQQSDTTFLDTAVEKGIEILENTWGSSWFDYDNDSYLDLFVASGSNISNIFFNGKNYFFQSSASSSFVRDTSIFIGDYGAKSTGLACGDFNNDGYPDVVIRNSNTSHHFLWKNSGGTNNYIKISLKGTVSNTMAIGAEILVFTANQTLRKYLVCGENYLGQNSQHHLFGLAQHNIVDSVHVIYPSGIVDRYYNLQVNQSYNLIEGETNASFQVEVLGNQTFCEGDSLILQAPGALSYLWNTGDTLQHLKVFEEGSYRVSIIDSLGQSRTSDWVFINRIEQPAITTSLENISCFGGSDGSIELEVVNDGENYMVIWPDSSEGLILDSLSAGTYIYRYLDEYGCELMDSIELSSPFPINAQFDIQNQTANQLGSIDFILNGGTPPYQIVLSNDTIAGAVDSLVAGFYFLQIMDYNSCAFSDTLEILFLEDTVINSIENGINGELSLTLIPGSEVLLLETQTQLEGSMHVRWFSALGKRIAEDELSIRRDQSDYRITYPNQLSDGLYFIRFDMKGVSKTFPILRKSK